MMSYVVMMSLVNGCAHAFLVPEGNEDEETHRTTACGLRIPVDKVGAEAEWPDDDTCTTLSTGGRGS